MTLLYGLAATLTALLGISLDGYALLMFSRACSQTVRDMAGSVRGWRERSCPTTK